MRKDGLKMQEFNMLFAVEDADAEWLAGQLEELDKEIKKRSSNPAPDIENGKTKTDMLDEAQARMCKIEAWMKAATAELSKDDSDGYTMICYIERAAKDAAVAKNLLGNVISGMYKGD